MTNSYAPLREDRLRRLLPGRDLLRLEEADSTLTQMKRFAAAGARDGAVLVADGLTCCEAPDDDALAACCALGEKLAAE